MSITKYHRFRRRSSHEKANSQKDNKQEQSFFSTSAGELFFQPAIQRKCKECEEEDKKVQKKDVGNASASAQQDSYAGSLQNTGEPLTAVEQQFYEERFGYDFSHVKIHKGSEASESAKALHAKAYAIGNHIVFNDQYYQPGTEDGKKLMAHELTHVLQQNKNIRRAPEEESRDNILEQLPSITVAGKGTSVENKMAYGNCEGVSVQGVTVANYDHGTYSATTTSVTRATACGSCTGNDCITAAGNLVSVFNANPVVSLPSVPAGLNECEHAAVQTFINTTLSRHEQQHVNAFNTYDGTVTTPFTYTGCRTGFDAYILAMHNRIEAARVSGANALSNALDPFNVPIPCNCPDPEPDGSK